ncbi:futalosine hydrolase [bacterium]|nr:futalosine hydrolase [bacterium]
MKILIVTATAFESEHISKQLIHPRTENSVVHGTINSHAISILATGIGMMNTAYFLTKTLAQQAYDLVVNIGICGSYRREIPLGSVVHIHDEIFSELGATDSQGNFIDLEKMGFKLFEKNGKTVFNCIVNVHQPSDFFRIDAHVIPGRSLTINTVNGDDRRIADAQKRYNPDFENMEGGAVAYVCMQESVPYLEFRAVSNYVEPRNTQNWKIELASQNVQNFILNLLTNSNP